MVLKKIALIGAIGLCLNLVGCGKAEITSECSLSGNGDYKCNFKNSGNAEGSSCAYLLLGEKPRYPGASKFSETADRLSFGLGLTAMRLNAFNQGRIPNIADLANVRTIIGTEGDKFNEEIRKEFQESKLPLNEFIGKNKEHLSYYAVAVINKGLSGQVCSGLVRAGDIRDGMDASLPTGSWGKQ